MYTAAYPVVKYLKESCVVAAFTKSGDTFVTLTLDATTELVGKAIMG